MMLKDLIELYRNQASETGFSALAGDPFEVQDEFISYRVEVHLFRDAATAEAFVSGMRYVGLGNAVAITWETGTTASNRVVIIAKFDEPPAAEQIVVVEHRATDADGKAVAASLHQRLSQDLLDREQDEKEHAALREALTKVGISEFTFGRRWLRWPAGFTATWMDAGGPFKLTKDVWELLEGTLDMVPTIRRIAEPSGVSFDKDDREIILEDLEGEDGVMRAMEVLQEVVLQCAVAKAQSIEEQFRSSVKLTPSRRRFLKAGIEFGVRRFVNRGNLKAIAGTNEIGRSEINTLIRIGWMSDKDGQFAVTEAGIAALESQNSEMSSDPGTHSKKA